MPSFALAMNQIRSLPAASHTQTQDRLRREARSRYGYSRPARRVFEIREGPCILRGGFSEAGTYHASKQVITPVVFLMLPSILRDAVCWLFGHRVPWGEECCARCDRVPGDELAP